MANTQIRLIIFVEAENGEALYSQQKQDQELTVPQIIIAKLKLKLKNVGKTTTIQVWPKSNPLQLYNGSDKKIHRIRSDRQSPWYTIDRDSWYFSDQDQPQEKEMKKGKIIA